MRERAIQDVSKLPTWGFGTRSTPWWGTLGFVGIEGTAFALAVGAYLYLIAANPAAPPVRPPGSLWPATALTILLILSAAPNAWLEVAARRQNLPQVRIGLIILSLFGAVVLALRGLEIAWLGLRWDQNAYTSMVWIILGLHTVHIATDFGDTLVLTVLMFTRHAQPRRFSDVTDNAFYWYFVVAAWLPLYGLVYWFPVLMR